MISNEHRKKLHKAIDLILDVLNYPYKPKIIIEKLADVANIVNVLEVKMGKIRPYRKDKCTPLEQFMIEVGMLVNCLPCFADPTFDGGNSHIKRRIEELLSIESAHIRLHAVEGKINHET